MYRFFWICNFLSLYFKLDKYIYSGFGSGIKSGTIKDTISNAASVIDVGKKISLRLRSGINSLPGIC